MSQPLWRESGCSNPAADHSAEIAGAAERRDSRARRGKLAHPIRLGFGTECHVPDSRRHPENRVRLADMMRQMARAQARFDRARGAGEMNPVVKVLIRGESAHDS